MVREIPAPSLNYSLCCYAPCFDILLLPAIAGLHGIDQILPETGDVRSQRTGDLIPLLDASYTCTHLAHIGLERSAVPDPLPLTNVHMKDLLSLYCAYLWTIKMRSYFCQILHSYFCHRNALIPSCYQIAPSYRKMCDFNKAIKTSSRRPTEQCFCILEPLHWYLHKVKKWTCTHPLERANRAVNMHSRGPRKP